MTVRMGKRFFILLVLLCYCLLVFPPVYAADIYQSPDSPVGMIQDGVDSFISDALNDKSRLNSHYTDFMSRGDKYASEGNYDRAFEEYNGALHYLNDPSHAASMGETIKNQRMAIVYNHAAEVYHQRGAPGDDIKRQNAIQTAEKYDVPTSTGGTLCLMNTVFNRTALAGSMQLVRDYRDGTIMKSYAGSRFMEGFNAWYYSFSPKASVYVEEHSRIKPVLEFNLAPTIMIVLISMHLCSLFWFNAELAAISAFIVGGMLYGLVYFFPLASVIIILAGRKGIMVPSVAVMKTLFIIWAGVLATLVLAVLVSMDSLTVLSSGLLVVCSVVLASGTASLLVAGYVLRTSEKDSPVLLSSDTKKRISG